MKRGLILFLILAVILLINVVYSQNETINGNENETIADEGNVTENETVAPEAPQKTLLTDCSKTCNDNKGCICPSGCEKAEANYKSTCGKKKVQEVSLCDGCLVEGTCMEIGTQKEDPSRGLTSYCSTNKQLETAKEVDEGCEYDYECLTYSCEDNLCVQPIEEESTNYGFVLVIGGIILVAILVFVALKLLPATKKAHEEKKGLKKEEIFERKTNLPEYKYKYRPEFDVLEKKLRESLGKPKR